jgi:23S rRNA pseudouridine1911/1915/1917 synthase
MIIYEDKNILAINKPAGMLVHPAPTTNFKTKTLTSWLIKNYPETKTVGDDPKLRPGIVHRLDKDTSGVLIVAKNQKTFEYLKKQFKNKQIKKTYIALIKGVVKDNKGTISTPVKKYTKSREAVTEYKVIKKFNDYTLLEVSPKTGRTHQIRIHLKSIGHPIVCEKLYTKRPNCPFGLKRHFLHAAAIELKLPDDVKIKLEADLPPDLKTALKLAAECGK